MYILATLNGSEDVAKVLLENGADVNTCDEQGKNVLMVSMRVDQNRISFSIV